MKITDPLLQQLRLRRLELGYSLTDISKKSINSEGKTLLSVATLSAIFKANLSSVKDSTFKLLADILQINSDHFVAEETTIKVAFGVSCWSAPIINAIVKDTEKRDDLLNLKNLLFSCFATTNGEPVPLRYYNQKPSEGDNILTASEILSLLKNESIDIGFLPVMTTERSVGIMRAARVMNTTKSGVYLCIVEKKTKKGTSDLEKIEEKFSEIKKELSQQNHFNPNGCYFVFPKESIAQILVEKILFNNTTYKKKEIEIKSTIQFQSEIQKQITTYFRQSDAKYFVYAGWDYQIDKLEKLLKKEKDYAWKVVDGYKFTEENHPYAPMSYDCVFLEKKYDYLKNHIGLNRLLSMLGENVKELNSNKFSISSSSYRLINDFLDMDQDFCDKVLNRINWEFLIYPELLDRNLK